MSDQREGSEVGKVVRSTKGLRAALFVELDRLRNREITHKDAQATARLAENILATVKLEMRMYHKKASEDFIKLPDTPSLDL